MASGWCWPGAGSGETAGVPTASRILAAWALVLVVGGCGAGDGGDGTAEPDHRPQPYDSFQWQLSGYPPDTSTSADTWDLDLFETPAEVVDQLHEAGTTVACYFSAGTYEEFREDAVGFPADTRGEPLPDFPDERWLDIREQDALAPVIEARLNLCAEKGFDAVEMDNLDAYANESGFPLTAEHQLVFNRWLAAEAREQPASGGSPPA
jgi:hypothetical protein